MKVAIVQNRQSSGVINVFGQPCPEVYGAKTIEMVTPDLRISRARKIMTAPLKAGHCS